MVAIRRAAREQIVQELDALLAAHSMEDLEDREAEGSITEAERNDLSRIRNIETLLGL